MDENQFKLFTAGVLRRHGSKQPLGELKEFLDMLAWNAARQFCCYKHAAAAINTYNFMKLLDWLQTSDLMYKSCHNGSASAKFLETVTQQCLDKGMKLHAAFGTAYQLGRELYNQGVDFEKINVMAVDLDTDEGKAIMERVSMGKEHLQ